MDSTSPIDLFPLWGTFWIFVAVSLVVLALLRGHAAKSWLFCAINLAFAGVFLDWEVLVPIAGAAAFFGLLRVLPRLGPRLALPLLVVLLVGFLFHKGVFPDGHLGLGRRVLTFVGYSYVMLRLIDVGRAVLDGRREPPPIHHLINYLMPFHMLAAGPIQSYDDYCRQPGIGGDEGPKESPHTTSNVLRGVEEIGHGLFKKYVLAYGIDAVFLTGFTAGTGYSFIEAQFFFIWLYLDFSAYSNIAVGIGRLLGIHTPVNFNRPYLARNLTDFWERWHISLSQWIRNHLFIPIQLTLMRSRWGKYRIASSIVAISIAFALCGLWHGISLGFFLWGLIHVVGLAGSMLYRAWLEKRLSKEGMKKYLANPWIRAAAMLLTFEWVALSLFAIWI